MPGRNTGDVFSATVPPEQGCGLRNEAARRRIPIKHLLTKGKLKAGRWCRCKPVEVFGIEIVAIRDATGEELVHAMLTALAGISTSLCIMRYLFRKQ